MPPLAVVVGADVVVGALGRRRLGAVSVAVADRRGDLPESSRVVPGDDDQPTTNPITSATGCRMIQRVRVVTARRLYVSDPAEDPERLVDLGLADHQRRQQAQRSSPTG